MQNNQKKRLYAAISGFVTAILLTGLGFSALEWWTDKGPSTWGKKKGEDMADTGGMFVEDGDDPVAEPGKQNIALTVHAISREEYDDYGIMPIAESAQTITATVTPTNAEDKKLVWSIAWKSGASGQWSNGKTVTEYVSGSASQDTMTYTLSCNQAFGETIVVTAAIEGNEAVKATKNVQYQQKATGKWKATIAYTNTTTAKNITWTFGTTGEAFNTTVKFPQATTATELKNYYSTTGSNKGTYSVTVEPALGTVYTVAATIGKVELEFRGANSSSKGYYRAMTLAGMSNATEIRATRVVASGTGKTLSGFDFVTALGLNEITDSQFTSLRQALATNTTTVGTPHIGISIKAEVNGAQIETSQSVIYLTFDKTSLGTFASSVSLGSGDITF